MPYLMNNTGFIYTLETALNLLLKFNLIFVGEEHLSRESHEAELALLSGLVRHDPDLVLALEMFERDIQPLLDDYLKGIVSEEQFLEGSRPWPNYPEDYRPLMELAKSKGLPVIAANVPRRAAAAVAKANRLSRRVMGPDAIYLPLERPYDSKKYQRLFMATMADMPPQGAMGQLNPQGLYKAQLVKDAVMAAALEPFLGRRILFCCGHFHSDYFLGIPYQLRKSTRTLKSP
ncbi:MAG TPA: ChaN family lipoprotein [Thermodesulfobacteriota bacterium]|nr:ChaN family lipoprotein [Thermodesulfobacteriota bacterium]